MADMDLQEKTRMQDTYVRMENIIDSIGKLGVFPPLVWVWSWDVTKSTYEDFKEEPEYKVNMDLDQVWEQFWVDADKNGFGLEYGTEDLYEAIRDWMIDADIVSYVEEEEEE